MRRVGVNRVYKGSGFISPAYVIMQGNRVADYGKIEDELAMTEWLGGYVFLSAEPENNLHEGMRIEDVAGLLLPRDAYACHAFHLPGVSANDDPIVEPDMLSLLEDDEYLL